MRIISKCHDYYYFIIIIISFVKRQGDTKRHSLYEGATLHIQHKTIQYKMKRKKITNKQNKNSIHYTESVFLKFETEVMDNNYIRMYRIP